MGIYESIGRLRSRKKVLKVKKELDEAGVNVSPETYLGFLMVLTLLLSLLATALVIIQETPLEYLAKLFEWLGLSKETFASQIGMLLLTFLISFVVFYIIVNVGNYVFLNLRKDARRKAVDEVLPDFLLLASANVRAGMTVDQALWYAAKPEFGLLSEEVTVIAKRSFAGEPLDKSLDALAARFDSKTLKRAVILIKQAMASGGEIASILERTGEDARKMQILRKEIAASLIMYVIFIAFAAAFATPFLFSVSHQLLVRLESVFAQVPTINIQEMTSQMASTTGSVPRSFINLQIGRLPITSQAFFIYTIVMLIVTNTFSSLIIGVIHKGDKKEGLKYLPILLVVSLTVYLLTNGILSTVLKYISF